MHGIRSGSKANQDQSGIEMRSCFVIITNSRLNEMGIKCACALAWASILPPTTTLNLRERFTKSSSPEWSKGDAAYYPLAAKLPTLCFPSCSIIYSSGAHDRPPVSWRCSLAGTASENSVYSETGFFSKNLDVGAHK